MNTSPTRKQLFEWFFITLLGLVLLLVYRFETQLVDLATRIPLTSHILILALVNLNILLVVLFVFLVLRNIAKLLFERQRHIPGAHLRTRLVVAFAGISLLPTVLLFIVAAGLISTSINNWFSNEIENSLQESLEVSQTYYKTSADNALYYAEQLARQIKEQKLLNQDNLPLLQELIQLKQKEYNLGVVEVFSATHEELVRAANPQIPSADITDPGSEDISEALHGKVLTRINSVGHADLIRGIVPIRSNWTERDIVGAVVVNYYVPYSLVSKMKEISTTYEQYKNTKLFKGRIQKVYIIVLLLVALVILFLAMWFGFQMARGITGPIQDLAEATSRVAAGDLEMTIEPRSQDEIGYLVKAFNQMTHDLRLGQMRLKEANQELQASNAELEQRRRYMEIVLKNVTAGVISLDQQGRLSTINSAAERLLRIKTGKVLGKSIGDVVGAEHMPLVIDFLQEMNQSGKDTLRKQLTFNLQDNKLTLQVMATSLRDESGDFIGTVVVFDDLTQLFKVQRMEAWREVARRIAHEIKNPLTPIQLSAQRLRRRYLERFTADDKVFDECTGMIVQQVEELKNLVNEFSNFARMPASSPSPNNLNEIINEALILFQQAHRHIRFSFLPEQGLPDCDLDREQIKRVLFNLLDNSVAAVEQEGEIQIETHYDAALQIVSFEIGDNGCGIRPEDKVRLFEPYFSTKKTGTGLGLAIVSTIISDHNGYIRVKDNQPRGTRFIIEIPRRLTA